MRGKRIKQINNLVIRYTDEFQYAVWTPDGVCWEDRMTLEQAESFCRETMDFVNRDRVFKEVDNLIADATVVAKERNQGKASVEHDFIKE